MEKSTFVKLSPVSKWKKQLAALGEFNSPRKCDCDVDEVHNKCQEEDSIHCGHQTIKTESEIWNLAEIKKGRLPKDLTRGNHIILQK